MATYQKIAQETASVGLRHGLWHSPECSSSTSAISYDHPWFRSRLMSLFAETDG